MDDWTSTLWWEGAIQPGSQAEAEFDLARTASVAQKSMEAERPAANRRDDDDDAQPQPPAELQRACLVFVLSLASTCIPAGIGRRTTCCTSLAAHRLPHRLVEPLVSDGHRVSPNQPALCVIEDRRCCAPLTTVVLRDFHACCCCAFARVGTVGGWAKHQGGHFPSRSGAVLQ